MATKSERFASLGKIQQQHYERALQAEKEAEQVVADIDASIAKVREYQQDYQNNLLELQQKSASSDQLMRMRTFIQQLMQMEVEQQRQRTEAQQRVQELHEKTLRQLKKVKINDKLVEQAEAEQLLHAKQKEAKQMDAVATSLYLRRASGV